QQEPSQQASSHRLIVDPELPSLEPMVQTRSRRPAADPGPIAALLLVAVRSSTTPHSALRLTPPRRPGSVRGSDHGLLGAMVVVIGVLPEAAAGTVLPVVGVVPALPEVATLRAVIPAHCHGRPGAPFAGVVILVPSGPARGVVVVFRG